MNAHTPTPWKVAGTNENLIQVGEGGIVGSCQYAAHGGRPGIPTLDESKANAEFIVTACNHHDELVGALRTLRRALNRIVAEDPRGFFGDIAEGALEAVETSRCSACEGTGRVDCISKDGSPRDCMVCGGSGTDARALLSSIEKEESQ